MALINCPECNHEVSDTAKLCPNCGFNLKKEKHDRIEKEQANIRKEKFVQKWEELKVKIKNIKPIHIVITFSILAFLFVAEKSFLNSAERKIYDDIIGRYDTGHNVSAVIYSIDLVEGYGEPFYVYSIKLKHDSGVESEKFFSPTTFYEGESLDDICCEFTEEHKYWFGDDDKKRIFDYTITPMRHDRVNLKVRKYFRDKY